jgi:hypothetical protein
MRTPLAPFERIRFELASEILCAHCHCTLDRHQPDPDRPEQLLGACLACGAWFLIDEEDAVMYALPDVRDLRDG